MRQLAAPPLPTGWRRLLLRLPIRLYRLHLGWLLGRRFLLLTHTGRVSGKPRQVVLEVVNRDAQTGAVTVASGFGRGADWYRNVRKTPQVTIRLGRRTLPTTATPIPAAEGAQVMADNARRHPIAAKRLSRFMGFEVDGSDADYRQVGTQIPFVRLTPR